MDEKLGLAEEREQGRLREKLALVAVLVPYHQAPQVCQTLLGNERYAGSLRRVALREAQRLTASAHRHQLPQREGDRLYLQVDGQLCPTREPRQSPEDQGYREAKAVLAFSQHDVAEVSKERHEILHKILSAKITDCEEFRSLFASAYHQAHGPHAAEVIVLADGAHWIWNLVEDLVPHAIQILDFSHASTTVGRGEMIYGDGQLRGPVGQGAGDPLARGQSRTGHCAPSGLSNIRPQLAARTSLLSHNAARMHYGTYRQHGYFIGSERLRVRGNKSPPLGSKAPACAGMSRILTPCSLYGVSFSSNLGNPTGMHALGWQPECQAIDMHPKIGTVLI